MKVYTKTLRGERSEGLRSVKGFALVATISVMVLLIMVALAMLSLSTITMRSDRHESARIEARANARMALMMALGELQKHMGPDQRVSAEAAMFDANLSTSDKIEDVENPYWVAVFDARHEDGGSMIQRDAQQGGEWDRRTKANRTGEFETDWQHGSRHKKALTYLVSGNEGLLQKDGNTDFQDAMSTSLGASESVELLKMDFPVGDHRRVRVKLCDIKKAGQTHASGTYAWWVRDLGSAAKVSVPDGYAGKKADPKNSKNGGYFRLLAAAEAPGKFVDSSLDVKPSDVGKILNAPQLGIIGASSRRAYREYWHDISTYGYGVLANVRTGKLKRNLSSYLEITGDSGTALIPDLRDGASVVSPGLSDFDYLLGIPSLKTYNWLGEASGFDSWEQSIEFRKETTPRFTTLREYARMADDVIFENGSTDQVDSKTFPSSSDFGRNNRPIQLRNPEGHSIQPIVTEATVYVNVSRFRATGKNGSDVYRLRAHYYPRITLWNPYNVKLKMAQMSIKFQTTHGGASKITIETESGAERELKMYVGGARSWRERGAIYMSLDKIDFEPGECLVFSPTEIVNLGDGNHNDGNVFDKPLSVQEIPDEDIFYYLDGEDGQGQSAFAKSSFVPGTQYSSDFSVSDKPVEWRQSGSSKGSDYFRVIFKGKSSSIGEFSNKPMVSYISGTATMGHGSEKRLIWDPTSAVKIKDTRPSNPISSDKPVALTRDSLRLRWIEEPFTNKDNSGISFDQADKLFSSAYFANWNIRAGFAIKSPFENSNPLPPLYYGIYSRDIGGPESEWEDNMPVMHKGKARGNPFGHHQDALESYVVYDIPRRETGLVSLAQLQHAKLSDYIWQAGFPIGNSFADPRIPRYQTLPIVDDNSNNEGWNESYFGSSRIAELGRKVIDRIPETEKVVYDICHNVNRALWDDYFLTSLVGSELDSFLQNPHLNPLPNSRLRLIVRGGQKIDSSIDLDFHRASRHLLVDGAFNVNSTSVTAWKALLSSTRNSGLGNHPFPGVLNPPGGAYNAGKITGVYNSNAMAGYRDLEPSEVERLAEEIVKQVKLRGPFLSLSDFINRRLVEDETGLMGALQAAISNAGLNGNFENGVYAIDNRDELDDYPIPASSGIGDKILDATRISQTLKPKSKMVGFPGYLTQANVLQTIAPAISARSDCFMIRAYGESKDAHGKVLAKAYCEAVVQRLPDPIVPQSEKYRLNPATPKSGMLDFGRKFVVQSFKWLSPDEI